MDSGERVRDGVARVLATLAAPQRVAVAFSGGLDSSVLLTAVLRVAPGLGWPAPRALHVDHGLQAAAARWRNHCVRVCAGLGVGLTTLRVNARAAHGESPEAAAREARYAALAAALEPGELLLSGHHADDQAETVLLNLLRGSGPQGLAAMAVSRPLGRGHLVRPLLGLRRHELHACARRWGLHWVEDPSNISDRHPRNRLRHEVIPVLERIAPGAVSALARSASLQREAAQMLAAQAGDDLRGCHGEAPDVLARDALCALPSPRRRAVLRAWFSGLELPAPGESALREAERQLVHAAPGTQPRVAWPGAEVRAYRNRIYALEASPPPPPAGRWRWCPECSLELPGGRLTARATVGAGLRAGADLEVTFRAGGERCRPLGRAHSQTLRRLLQEYRVPPWRRPGLPLLRRDGELVAVADLWVCADHDAQPGEPGWEIHWQPCSGYPAY